LRAPPARTPGGLWRHPAPYSRRSKVERGATAAKARQLAGPSGHGSTGLRAATAMATWRRMSGEPAMQIYGCGSGRAGDFRSPSARKRPALPAPPRCPLPAALVVFTTTTSPQLPPSPLLPPHVERGVSPAVLSRCDAGSGCRTSPLTLPSSPNSSVEAPRNRESYYFCTLLLVLHRTLYGRVSLIFPARVAGIHPHYNGIPQRGASFILPTM